MSPRATLGDPLVRDETGQTPVPIPTPTWYTASADSAAVSPPHRQVRKGDPIPGGYAAEREFQLSWSMLTGALAPTPSPGGMGSKGVDVVQVRGYHVYVGSLPMPAEGQPVPAPTVPTVPSLTLTTPDKNTVLGGYYVPAPPPTPPAPQDLPIWTPIKPNTAYAIQLQAIGLDGTPGPKSAVLNIQTPSALPPVAYGQAAPLATPGPLSFQQGRPAPNPASGNPGIWHLEFTATQGAASYQIYGNSNPRPGMASTPGLMDGDQLLGTAAQPAVVDSQAPVRASFDNPFRAGDRVELKVRAVRPEQLGGNSYSPFASSLTTVLPRTSAPAQPTSLRLSSSATSTTVPVTWNMDTPVRPPVREYRIYEASSGFKMAVQAPATSATVTGYQPSQTYRLQVTAVNTSGESHPSSVLEGTTAPA
ncbi:fibronectin type III domain-containing protein [Streptomyces sp. NBC_01264]|uniref:fibronectin type III domain-containing protein n=1 Tax=Streptomyces sp. NBC_01264 TaxID=2903804 RepID=UPI0022578BA5|nr:fibronectin type III domain-containing protein [Streptomyces sp. NBC_01264]MCX4783340.1 fibronectin type III domain-containing protein [Streptomyces sp. NBC_01264]